MSKKTKRQIYVREVEPAVWPDWPIFESFGNKLAYKSNPKHWWLFGQFWKGSLQEKIAVASIWTTFGNIWATFLFEYLVAPVNEQNRERDRKRDFQIWSNIASSQNDKETSSHCCCCYYCNYCPSCCCCCCLLRSTLSLSSKTLYSKWK